MEAKITSIHFVHEGGFASIEIMIGADDGAVGSVVKIGVSLDLASVREMNYAQLLQAAIAEARLRHKWLDAALRQA